MTDEDATRFVTGLQLQWSQIRAMATKKCLYFIRNYIQLLFLFLIPALFIVISMLSGKVHRDDSELPPLPISLNEYVESVTIMAKRSNSNGSLMDNIIASYENVFAGLSDAHKLAITNRDFQDAILYQYNESISVSIWKYVVGVSFNATGIIAWFNNQGYHTAPLAINIVNNAILK